MDVIVLGARHIVPTVSSVRVRDDKTYLQVIFKNDDKINHKAMTKADPLYLLYEFDFHRIEGKVEENILYLLGLDKSDIEATNYDKQNNNDTSTIKINDIPN